mmetsp:Transcript_20155/g.41786  ORF Transcript_20155/g.41786 Transcript_20155/m.41786 type:complete len:221 (-) Transcript_20155:1127-1789(-)
MVGTGNGVRCCKTSTRARVTHDEASPPRKHIRGCIAWAANSDHRGTQQPLWAALLGLCMAGKGLMIAYRAGSRDMSNSRGNADRSVILAVAWIARHVVMATELLIEGRCCTGCIHRHGVRSEMHRNSSALAGAGTEHWLHSVLHVGPARRCGNRSWAAHLCMALQCSLLSPLYGVLCRRHLPRLASLLSYRSPTFRRAGAGSAASPAVSSGALGSCIDRA